MFQNTVIVTSDKETIELLSANQKLFIPIEKITLKSLKQDS
jgi:hypothetical protein